MALTTEWRKATNNPTDDINPSGGAMTATVIPGLDVGEVIPRGTYEAVGGADTGPWYYAIFLTNTSAADTLFSPVLYVPNVISGFAVDGTIQLVSTSASDTNDVKVYSRNAAGTPQTETITMTGVTPVNGTLTHKASTIWKIESLASGSLTPWVGQITVTRGSTIAIIPAPFTDFYGATVNFDFATGEYDVGSEATLNTGVQVPNRLSAPTGVSFSRPRDFASGIAAPANLTAGDKWQIWIKWRGNNGTQRTTKSRLTVVVRGTD